MKNSTIRVLDPDTVKKIAAGEVVERPASVVKELVENAIDAGAENITVDLKNGGEKLIRVIDDGSGMDAENARLSVLPHATSKIENISDLSRVRTMGFRGEALASIAAVSLFLMETSTGEGSGVSLEVKDQPEPELGVCARAKGTTITVSELFYNIPARKKFLKSERTELNKIIQIVEEIALVRNRISFTLQHNGKKLIEIPAASDSKGRIRDLFGEEITSRSEAVDYSQNGIRVTGLLGHPQVARRNRSMQYLFVNLRPVSHKQLQFAVKRGYGELLPHDRFAAYVLFIDVDPSKMDVNIHPAKREIRFSEENQVRDTVYRAVSKTLRHPDFAPADFSIPKKQESGTFYQDASSIPEAEQAALPLVTDIMAVYENSSPILESFQESGETILGKEKNPIPESSQTFFQLHKMYIFTPIKKGLLIVDQHAAHERILYEKALVSLSAPADVSQPLLFPVVIELKPAEFHIVEEVMPEYRKLGFDLKPFGGNSIAVEAVPPPVSVNAVEPTLREMIQYFAEGKNPETERVKRVAASFACGAAIKAGKKLSQEEMASLIDKLFSAKNPYTCPHGRPTIIRMSMEEISKRFLRS